MIVSDTSPINYLILIDRINLWLYRDFSGLFAEHRDDRPLLV